MPEFDVWGNVTGRKFLGRFVADSQEQAVERAQGGSKARICLCDGCKSEVEGARVQGGEAKEVP